MAGQESILITGAAGFIGSAVARAAVERALAGMRCLLHVAADYRLWARDPEEIVRNNLDGTGAVMRAALAAGVERVVYTSSVATLRVGPETVASNEDEALAPEDRKSVV